MASDTPYHQLKDNEQEGDDDAVTVEVVPTPTGHFTAYGAENNEVHPEVLHALKTKRKIYKAEVMLSLERLFEFFRYHWLIINICIAFGLFAQLNWYSSIHDDWASMDCYEANDRSDLNTAFLILYITFGSFIIYPIIWIKYRLDARAIFNERTFNGCTGKIGKNELKYMNHTDWSLLSGRYKISYYISLAAILTFIPVLIMSGIVWSDINQFEVDCLCTEGICVREYTSMTYTDWLGIYSIYIVDMLIVIYIIKNFKKNSVKWIERTNKCCCCFGN